MFEGANQAAIGHLAGVNAVNLRTLDEYQRMYRELRAMYDRLKARCDAAEKEVQDLRLRLAVSQAREVGDDAILDQWKALYPQSPLRQVVGTFRDGHPKTKATLIWENAFDDAARKRGITNPLAHRIS